MNREFEFNENLPSRRVRELEFQASKNLVIDLDLLKQVPGDDLRT